eukprot:scaffold7693_cov1587-Prasinococcus_capsulatus_cf.AAC.1
MSPLLHPPSCSDRASCFSGLCTRVVSGAVAQRRRASFCVREPLPKSPATGEAVLTGVCIYAGGPTPVCLELCSTCKALRPVQSKAREARPSPPH